jgi:hypothetical protein
LLLVGIGGATLHAADAGSSVPSAAESKTPTRLARARVLTPDGQPIEDARIEPYCDVKEVDWVNTQWTFGSRHHEPTSTDGDGFFEYRQPYCDRVGVRVIAPGYARKLVGVPYGNDRVDIMLGKGMTVTGRLLKDGRPVAGIEVAIAQVNRSSETYLDEIIATTDRDGRFILRDVAPYEKYEIYGKRRSLKLLGVTGEIAVTTGEPETTVEAGDLAVTPGIKLTGRLMRADGEAVGLVGRSVGRGQKSWHCGRESYAQPVENALRPAFPAGFGVRHRASGLT